MSRSASCFVESYQHCWTALNSSWLSTERTAVHQHEITW